MDAKEQLIVKVYVVGIVVCLFFLAITVALWQTGHGSIISNTSAAFNATASSTSSSSSSSSTSSAVAATASGISIFAILYIIAQVIERIIEPFSNWQILGGHDDDDKNSRKNKARKVSHWLIASGLGILFCFLFVGMLQIIGISFTVPINDGHFYDAVISGLIVGSGTKPLHDFINVLDGKSDTSGN